MRLLFFQLPQQARAVWQVDEQLSVISCQQAIKRPKTPTLVCKQDANRHYFTRIQFGPTIFPYPAHHMIDMVKNVNNSILGDHDRRLSDSLDTYSLALFVITSTCTIG